MRLLQPSPRQEEPGGDKGVLGRSHARPSSESNRSRGNRRAARKSAWGMSVGKDQRGCTSGYRSSGPRRSPVRGSRLPCRWRRGARRVRGTSCRARGARYEDRHARGAGAGDRVQARQARGLGIHETPGRFAAAALHLRVRAPHLRVSAVDPTRGRWGTRRGAVGTASNHGENRGRERSGRAPDASGPRRWPGERSRRSTR